MSRKIALTSNGPLAGKSTLAKHLEKEYGFIHADHSLTLVSRFVEEWNALYPRGKITVDWVYQHKEWYRRDLQQFGYKVGFNDERAMIWIQETLVRAGCDVVQARCPDAPPVLCPNQNVVFDSFRGKNQAWVLDELGFELVQINLTDEVRCARAKALGKSCEDLIGAMEAAPELEMGISTLDVVLDGSLPVEVLGRVLMHRPEGSHGVQIFGNRV